MERGSYTRGNGISLKKIRHRFEEGSQVCPIFDEYLEGQGTGMISSSGLRDRPMNFDPMVNCTNWCNKLAFRTVKDVTSMDLELTKDCTRIVMSQCGFGEHPCIFA